MSRYRLKVLVASLTVALLLFASGSAARAQDKHTTDSLEQVKQALADNKAILLDVREPTERKAGYLESSESLPLSQMKKVEDLKRITKDWDKSKIVYTHCAAGKRALNCAPMLKDLGFEVRALKAGYKDLLGAGFEKATDD
jgi:phage shock protein E